MFYLLRTHNDDDKYFLTAGIKLEQHNTYLYQAVFKKSFS